MAVVRYIVSDVSAAIPFYTEQLGFELKINPEFWASEAPLQVN